MFVGLPLWRNYIQLAATIALATFNMRSAEYVRMCVCVCVCVHSTTATANLSATAVALQIAYASVASVKLANCANRKKTV